LMSSLPAHSLPSSQKNNSTVLAYDTSSTASDLILWNRRQTTRPARGYLMHLPHYNSVFKYLESEALTPYLYELIKLSAAPLKSIESDFAVDSSGFSTGQFMRWLDVKYGTKEDRRQWLKLNLMVGVKTNIVTSVEVSDGYAHDYPFYKGLVDRTADSGFHMKEVSADKGYLGATNMLATLQRGAIPYIPFKINSVPDSRGSYGPKSELWMRMYHFYALHRAEFYSTITTLKRRNDVSHD
jgi:hypothetical protein